MISSSLCKICLIYGYTLLYIINGSGFTFAPVTSSELQKNFFMDFIRLNIFSYYVKRYNSTDIHVVK